jgi:hypothetical protein
MKRDTEQTRVIPALADAAEIHDERFRRRGRVVLEMIHAPFAFPDHELRRARHWQKADRIEESEIRKRDDRGPARGERRRLRREHAIEVGADVGT